MTTKTIPVGIDLGTTFSAIAHLDIQGRPCTIANSEGELTTPSVVFFDSDDVIVGTEAAIAGETDASRVARAAKRDMGGERYRKLIDQRYLPPEVIQSFVLKRLKDDASLKLGEFTKAVITVPAYFNEPRRKATQDAGKLAGLDVIDIINEPTAAALAYGVQRGFLNAKAEAEQRELILVYDLGGGTFDVTLMVIDGSKYSAVGTAGDVYLGGIDWDKRIYEYAAKQIETRHGLDLQTDSEFQEKLMAECVRSKKTLSARTETAIRLEYGGQRFKVELSRDQFEDITKDLLERTRLTTDRLLRDAKLGWQDLTRLLLVGGSTRMPMVTAMLEKESGLKVDRSLSPDESVAHGAAIYAGILLKHGSTVGDGISVTNVNSHDLGVLGVDPQTREPRRKVVIPRNHKLPATSAKKFITAKDGQKKIVVRVVEGGTEAGHGATMIGKCVVTDLPASIRQGTEVLVTFNYLNSGRLEVIAEIPSLNLSADSTIERASGMSKIELVEWKDRLKQGVKFLNLIPIDDASPADILTSKSESPETDVVDEVDSHRPSKKRALKPTAKIPASTPEPEKSARLSEVKTNSGDKQKPSKKSVASKNSTGGLSTPKIETGEKQVKPVTNKQIVIELDDEIRSQEIVEFEEDSAIFAFGDETKPADAGASVLEFLDETLDKKSSASGSALDQFLSELD